MRRFAYACIGIALLLVVAGLAREHRNSPRVVVSAPKTTNAPPRPLVVTRTERGRTITRATPAWALVVSSLSEPGHGFVRDKRG